MAKDLQVGSDIFSYPEQGEKAGWGEDATAWAEAVSERLNDLSGPNDILLSTANLANNQSTPAEINGLKFDTSKIQSVKIDYFIERTYDSGSTTAGETGQIIGHYDGSEFVISIGSTPSDVERTNVEITVDNTGQFFYTSDEKTNHQSSIIRYRAKTIDKA